MKCEQSMSEEKESKTEKSSRPTAFSLRTLLLLVLIFALAMGWALDRAKMKLSDVGEDEQKGLADSNQKEDLFAGPVFDKTEFGEEWKV